MAEQASNSNEVEAQTSSSNQVQDTPKANPASCKPVQAWTIGGYPIVERKYLNLSTGKVEEIAENETVTFGPPMIDVYWHNAYLNDKHDRFQGFRGCFTGSVTEYLIRVAEALKKGTVTISSLSAAVYSVNVILHTELSKDEMFNLLYEARVVGHN